MRLVRKLSKFKVRHENRNTMYRFQRGKLPGLGRSVQEISILVTVFTALSLFSL